MIYRRNTPLQRCRRTHREDDDGLARSRAYSIYGDILYNPQDSRLSWSRVRVYYMYVRIREKCFVYLHHAETSNIFTFFVTIINTPVHIQGLLRLITGIEFIEVQIEILIFSVH